MKHFWLIQRGVIRKEGGPFLTGKNGVVSLDYMGSAEFEFGAIPYSYRKIMHDFEQYSYFDAKVPIPGGQHLIVFCKKDLQEAICEGIRNFIELPYQLKEWSDLEKLTRVADITKPYTICRTQFWWCIDRGEQGQWMACLGKFTDKIYDALHYDYENWWMAMPEEKRETLHQEALRHF